MSIAAIFNANFNPSLAPCEAAPMMFGVDWSLLNSSVVSTSLPCSLHRHAPVLGPAATTPASRSNVDTQAPSATRRGGVSARPRMPCPYARRGRSLAGPGPTIFPRMTTDANATVETEVEFVRCCQIEDAACGLRITTRVDRVLRVRGDPALLRAADPGRQLRTLSSACGTYATNAR